MNSAPLPVSKALSLHIHSIPKMDKSYHVSCYLREQSAHAEMYTAEGRAIELSWTREKEAEALDAEPGKTAKPQSPLPNLAVDCGFETPVLKPRAKYKAYSPPKEVSPQAGAGTSNANKVKQRRIKRKRSPLTTKGSIKKQTRRNREREPEGRPSLDNEHSRRLSERRERKRTKRAVMKALSSRDSSSEENSVQIDTKKKSAQKSAKPKGLDSFALMHGFTATNVGARRLTVKPTLNPGVFSKGKASTKCRPVERDAKVSRAKKVNPYSTFTEDDFLDKAVKIQKPRKTNLKTKQVKGHPSSCSYSSHSKTSSLPSKNNLTSQTKKLTDEIITVENSENCSTGVFVTSHDIQEASQINNQVRAESIVWDIELDSSSRPSRTPVSELDDEAPSVLINGLSFSWANPSGDETQVDAISQRHEVNSAVYSDTQPEAAESLSASIAPSDSASQCVPSRRDLPTMTEATSRYFVSGLPRVPLPPMNIKNPSKGEEITTVVASEYDSNLEIECDSFPTVPSINDAPGNDTTQPSISAGYLIGVEESPPLAGLQDYECFDRDLHLWSSDDLNCISENLTIPHETVYGGVKQLSFSDLSFPPGYKLEACPDSQFDDHYGADEATYGSTRCGDSSISFEADETWDTFVDDDAKGLGGDTFPTRNFKYSESLVTGELDMHTDNEARLVDFTGMLTEGKALLLGYTKEGSHTPFSPMPSLSCQPHFTPAEIHVAKTLRNHWLPQRL